MMPVGKDLGKLKFSQIAGRSLKICGGSLFCGRHLFASGNEPEGKGMDGTKSKGGRGSRMFLRCGRWDPGDP